MQNNNEKIIDFSKDFEKLDNDIEKTNTKANSLLEIENNNKELLNEIYNELGFYHSSKEIEDIQITNNLLKLNSLVDEIIIPKYKGTVSLSTLDVVVGICSGLVASLIDIVFVGTPEVVKIYKGGENFDGSILSSILRKIGNGDDALSNVFKGLSDKCKVPYDVSVKKDVVVPDNHRLRGLAHDPLFGLFFAIVDILLGTTTTIDNNGMLRILVNNQEYPTKEKYLSIIYYFGHLLSDLCTARGLPIPGFFLTQFFENGGEDNSIASVCEAMYKDGYDLRHLASMSTPVVVKNLILNMYLKLKKNDETILFETIASKQIKEQQEEVYKYKLRLISDAVACGGNVVKFFIPPTMGNWTALNLPEWLELIHSTIANIKYEMRDKKVEEILFNRITIDKNWDILLSD